MNPLAVEANEAIQAHAPAVLRMLSDLGKQLYFPKGILTQTAEAKQKATRYNATIGEARELQSLHEPVRHHAPSVRSRPRRGASLRVRLRPRRPARRLEGRDQGEEPLSGGDAPQSSGGDDGHHPRSEHGGRHVRGTGRRGAHARQAVGQLPDGVRRASGRRGSSLPASRPRQRPRRRRLSAGPG